MQFSLNEINLMRNESPEDSNEIDLELIQMPGWDSLCKAKENKDKPVICEDCLKRIKTISEQKKLIYSLQDHIRKLETKNSFQATRALKVLRKTRKFKNSISKLKKSGINEKIDNIKNLSHNAKALAKLILKKIIGIPNLIN